MVLERNNGRTRARAHTKIHVFGSIAGEPRELSPPIGLRAVAGVEHKQIPIGRRGRINLHMHRRGRRLHIPGDRGWEHLTFIYFFPLRRPYVDDLAGHLI